MPQARTSRSRYRQLLTIVSCFAVVMLHCSTVVFAPARNATWVRAVGYQSVFIFAVPIFFMVSGANLLGYRKRYSTRTFLKRRLSKVGIALLAASTACYLLYGLFPSEFYAAQPIADTFGPIADLRGLYLCTIESIYWFLYAILRIYLLTPFIALAIEKRPDAEKYLLLGGFVSAFALPALLHGHPNLVAANPMPAPFTNSSLFYFVLGHYLDQNLDRLLDGVRRSRAMVACVALALVSVGTSYVLTRIFNSPTRFSAGLWEPGKPYDGYWCSAGGILAIPYATSLFVLARCAEARLQRMSDVGAARMSGIAALTFGIYLVHNPMLRWMSMHVVGAKHGSFGVLLASYPLAKGIVAAIASALMVAAGRWAIAQTKALLARQVASASA